jgi:ribosomal protein L31
MGEKMFIKCQYGKETTRGTAVAATKRWLGTCNVPKDRDPQHPEYTLGVRARSGHSHIAQILADPVNLSLTQGYFQALPMIFSIGLKGNVTPVEETTSEGDYKWTFTPDLTGLSNPDTITLEVGDDTEQYEMEYVMARRIVIAGQLGQNGYVSVDAECFSRQVTVTDFTAGIAVPTIEPMLANLTQFYVDSNWATIGTTQKTNILREFSIEILTGNHPKFYGNGKTFTTHAEGYLDVMATFTFEGNSEADTLFDAFQSQTPKAIRLLVPGSQIGSGEPHSLTIDTYGTFDEVIPLGGEADGNNLHTAIFHGLTDLQSTQHMLAVEVVTDSQTI